jgi:hypothetical protein
MSSDAYIQSTSLIYGRLENSWYDIVSNEQKLITVFVFENVIQSYFLATRVFSARSPDNSTANQISASMSRIRSDLFLLFHLLRDFLVNSIAEIFHGTLIPSQNHGSGVVRW